MTTQLEPQPNLELILDTLAAIERDPASWRQGAWAVRTECGTAYCFAGHAVNLSGVELGWDRADRVYGPLTLESDEFADVLEAAVFAADGRFVYDHARHVLGLTSGQAGNLFCPINDLDSLYSICAGILGLDTTVLRDKVKDRLG